MIISHKDLSLISNYTESSNPSQPQMTISFIDMVESESEEMKLQRKTKNRELAIDAIIDNKIDEFNNREIPVEYTSIDSLSGVSIISPKIKQILVKCINYTTCDEIYFSIMKKLEQLTSVPMNGQSMDLKKETEDIQEFYRKIITNIMYCNSRIAMESRLGPGNTIIVGCKAYQYLLHSSVLLQSEEGICKAKISNCNVIPSNLISDNKIIIMRTSTRFENGLNCGNFTNDLRYFVTETPDFEKCIKWFSII
jgi:hypothetical protein